MARVRVGVRVRVTVGVRLRLTRTGARAEVPTGGLRCLQIGGNGAAPAPSVTDFNPRHTLGISNSNVIINLL